MFRRQREELKIKIPRKIKVGALVYKVEIVDYLQKDWIGETTHSNLTVKILRGTPEGMENTFWHELIHCFNSALGPEETIQMLANSLHNFIKDNPRIFK